MRRPRSRFGRIRGGKASVVLLIAIVAIALFAPILASDRIIVGFDGEGLVLNEARSAADATTILPVIPHSPNRIDLTARLEGPSARHWLGTDDLGRDLAARLVHGGRVSLLVGFASAVLSLLIGVFFGSLAGYGKGWADWIVMRTVEVTLCFPFLVVVLAFVAAIGNSITTIILAIALTGWTTEARLIRGEMLRLRESEFAVSARASGAGHLRIAFRHLLPNALPPALVSTTFGVATAILIESALSFLGFGVPLPHASWGSVLATADAHLRYAWWLALFPGLLIFLTVAACNLLGDALRRALNPRLSVPLS
jgi:peptide/nickel transport system permease protein